MPPVDERRLREDYAALESAKAQLEGLAKQQQLIQLAVEEHVRARETVKQVSERQPGEEMLIPIGADSYVFARISEDRDAVVGVGSGISIKRTPKEAGEILDSKIDDLSRAFKSITDRAAQMEAMIQELSEKVQAQIEALQSGAGSEQP